VGDSIVSWAAQSALLSERVDTITNRQYFYSDVGFFFLKDLIEQESGNSLDQFLERELYKTNDLELVFNPLRYYPDSLVAPTEDDQTLRNELIRGYVHDRNAALLGGVAGQAGLFGNARNIAKLMQIHLDHGHYADDTVFSSSTIEAFTTRHFTNNRRGWGWDMPALPAGRPGPEPDGPVSSLASANTFGHTGFTGTSVWIDPTKKLSVIFLTNRIYPKRENKKLFKLRPLLHDAVIKAIQ
jgi:CubicO group peptidase (beta-lactamase class C family)